MDFGQASDGVLGGGIGGGVGPRRVRGDGAVVDDAAAAGILGLHQPDGLLRAEKRAGEVDQDDGIPLLERQVLHRNTGGVDAGVVEQQIEPAELLADLREETADFLGLAHIGRDGEHRAARGLRLGGRLL